MTRAFTTAVAALTLATGALGAAQLTSPVEAQIRALIAASGAEIAVAARSVDGRFELLIDPDKPFHAASTMKVPVMIELYRQAKAGTLSLDAPLPIRNEFRSIVDGSAYKLSEGDDSDTLVYAAAGKTLTLAQLDEAMITVSSNFAANLLIEKLGVENIRATVTRLGAAGMQVLRGVEDQKAFDKGLNNSTTARGLLVLFDHLAHGTAVDPRIRRGDGRRAQAPEVQRRNPRGPAGRDRRRSQDGQHHPHPPRRRHRLRQASVRDRHPRARRPGTERKRHGDGGDFQGHLRESQSVTCSFVIAITIPAPD